MDHPLKKVLLRAPGWDVPADYILVGTFGLLLAGCLGEAPAPSAPPPGGELVTAWTAEESGRPGTGLYLRNDTTREILVRSVTLESCVGIREECREYESSVRLGPGETRRVLSVRRAHPERTFNFDWSFDWDYLDPGGADA